MNIVVNNNILMHILARFHNGGSKNGGLRLKYVVVAKDRKTRKRVKTRLLLRAKSN